MISVCNSSSPSFRELFLGFEFGAKAATEFHVQSGARVEGLATLISLSPAKLQLENVMPILFAPVLPGTEALSWLVFLELL